MEWTYLVELDMGGAGRTRSGKSPLESSESPRNLKQDGCGRISVKSPMHVLSKETRDEKGPYTEHLSYEWWASKEVDPSSRGLLASANEHQQVEVHVPWAWVASTITTRGKA